MLLVRIFLSLIHYFYLYDSYKDSLISIMWYFNTYPYTEYPDNLTKFIDSIPLNDSINKIKKEIKDVISFSTRSLNNCTYSSYTDYLCVYFNDNPILQN